MGTIGPNAKVRVDGMGRHDLATIEWKVRKEKKPFTQIGESSPDRYTSGALDFTFSGEAQSGPTGAFAIDWNAWCENDEEHPLVCVTSGRTERLVDCVIDEVGSSIKKDDGSFTKSISGKFKAIKHE